MFEITKDDIFPPPKIEEAVPPTLRVLAALLAELGGEGSSEAPGQKKRRFDLHFSRGCVHLRAGDHEAAVSDFERCVAIDPESVEARGNLAVAQVLRGRLSEAATQLKTAVLRNSAVPLLLRNLAVVEYLQGDERSAAEHLVKAVAQDPRDAKSLVQLGVLADREKRFSEAEDYYLRAFSADPSIEYGRNRLAEFAFDRGRESFEAGNVDEAFAVWFEAFTRYEDAFFSSREITGTRRSLVERFLAERGLEAAKNDYIAGRKADEDPELLSHRLFTRFFFSLGLIPELYCPQNRLAKESKRWKKQFSTTDAVFPFPHFRLGVIHCYQGKLESAAEEFSHCRDHLPRSKQRPLKLEEILNFVNEIKDLRIDSISLAVGKASDEHWQNAGFGDPFQMQAWKKTGFSPEEAARWKAQGLSAAASTEWARGRFAPEQARRWIDAGWESAKAAERWFRADFSPREAMAWAEQFPENFELAIQCRQVGFDDPVDAGNWMKIFMFPWDAVRWKEMGFSTKDAAVYVAEGVKDPLAAFNQRLARMRIEFSAQEYGGEVPEFPEAEESADDKGED